MKNLKIWSLALGLMLMITGTAQTIDSKNSTVDFTVKKTSGTLTGMKGKVILNTDDMSGGGWLRWGITEYIAYWTLRSPNSVVFVLQGGT